MVVAARTLVYYLPNAQREHLARLKKVDDKISLDQKSITDRLRLRKPLFFGSLDLQDGNLEESLRALIDVAQDIQSLLAVSIDEELISRFENAVKDFVFEPIRATILFRDDEINPWLPKIPQREGLEKTGLARHFPGLYRKEHQFTFPDDLWIRSNIAVFTEILTNRNNLLIITPRPQ